MATQQEMNLETNVEKYEFEPIKGYPMLNWKGKRPFRSTQYYPAQLKEVYGQEDNNGWINKIFWGDNLQVMSHLLKEFRGKVDLIYIDPPFDSKADYKKSIRIKSKTLNTDSSNFEEKQYTDIWSNDAYLQFMYERITLLRELLSDKGTIYVHCDYRKSHHIRLILDELFGSENLINEIIWKRRSGVLAQSSRYGNGTDTILSYSKSSEYTFNPQYTKEGTEDYVAERFRYEDENGKRYRLSPLLSPSYSPTLVYDYEGYKSPAKGWSVSLDTMKKFHLEGRLVFPSDKSKRIQRKQYLDEWLGKPIQNIWDDIAPINPQAKERVDYPTQKPVKLLRRIIETSSNQGDLVLDVFGGCGSTAIASVETGRRFITADINSGAIYATIKRIVEQKAGAEYFNVNNYEIFRNPVEAKELLIDALEIQKLDAGNIYDGEKDGYKVKIMPVNRIATKEDLNELVANFPYKKFEERKAANPNKPVEDIMLICMGHEASLGATLENECGYKLKVEVVDILRDKSNLTFKYDSEAVISIKDGKLIIEAFYPRNLLQKLSQQKEDVTEWREMVESIMIDWNYDGAVMEPSIIDIPSKNEFVQGEYKIPEGANNIKVKITDLLSESYEEVIQHG